MSGESVDESTSEVHLASALRIALMRITRRLRSERADEMLTLSQVSALATLRRRGPLSPSALAEFERVQPPSMTRIIAALENAGYVERKPHERDGRVSVIGLSEGGSKILEEDRKRHDAWLARSLATLTDEEKDALRLAAPIIEKLAES